MIGLVVFRQKQGQRFVAVVQQYSGKYKVKVNTTSSFWMTI